MSLYREVRKFLKKMKKDDEVKNLLQEIEDKAKEGKALGYEKVLEEQIGLPEKIDGVTTSIKEYTQELTGYLLSKTSNLSHEANLIFFNIFEKLNEKKDWSLENALKASEYVKKILEFEIKKPKKEEPWTFKNEIYTALKTATK